MDTQTIIDNAARCGLAWQRGHERGRDDERQNCYNDAPLSGEWAGESVRDLLGDLIGEAVAAWERDRGGDGSAQYFYDLACYDGDMTSELCEHYENGYLAAFANRSFCEGCTHVATLATHAVLGPDMVSEFRNLCCECAGCDGC